MSYEAWERVFPQCDLRRVLLHRKHCFLCNKTKKLPPGDFSIVGAAAFFCVMSTNFMDLGRGQQAICLMAMMLMKTRRYWSWAYVSSFALSSAAVSCSRFSTILLKFFMYV